MYVYMEGISALLGKKCGVNGLLPLWRNVPANLNPNIRLETIEARAGSSPGSSLGAEGEMGA